MQNGAEAKVVKLIVQPVPPEPSVMVPRVSVDPVATTRPIVHPDGAGAAPRLAIGAARLSEAPIVAPSVLPTVVHPAPAVPFSEGHRLGRLVVPDRATCAWLTWSTLTSPCCVAFARVFPYEWLPMMVTLLWLPPAPVPLLTSMPPRLLP